MRTIIVTDDKALELSRRANSDIRTIKVDNYIIKYLSKLKKSYAVQANNGNTTSAIKEVLEFENEES